MPPTHEPRDLLDSDSDEEEELDPAAEERRQRAIQLLAKVLKKPAEDTEQAGGKAADADAEAAFLRTLLADFEKGVKGAQIAKSVRDRLSVLGVQRGDVKVAASAKKTSLPSEESATEEAEEGEDANERRAAPRLPGLLERLRDGDLTAVAARVRTAGYWRSLAGDALACSQPADARATFPMELPISADELASFRGSLETRGYGAMAPDALGGWSWGSLAHTLAALRAAAGAFRAAGWPPAFIFTLDEAWELLDRLWTPMEAALGPNCRMDPSVFCWIAATPTPNDGSGVRAPPTAAPAGANFGVPHRDFTCLQSLRKSDGAPAVLSVWLPLNGVTADNGCMMVVPRPLDRHYTKRWAYAHMRPALPPDAGDDDGATEVRFNLAAARPLAPLAAGSIVAWVGNLIHWGTCCMPDSPTPARASVGFNFLADGERLQSSAPLLSRQDARQLSLDDRLALIARSVLAYSPWYALSDDAVSPDFFPDVPPTLSGPEPAVENRLPTVTRAESGIPRAAGTASEPISEIS